MQRKQTKSFEFGEVRKFVDETTGDEKTYIKVTADAQTLANLVPGATLYTELPNLKYERMLKSDKVASDKKTSIQQQLESIPAWVLKRVYMRVPSN